MRAARQPGAGPVIIGLVNGMPEEARAATERQFGSLVAAAGGDRVRMRPFALRDAALVIDADLDGLIVTGMPPRATDLRAELAWPSLVRLIDHAAMRGLPTLFSCLAAHAAVLHLHGIERRRLPAKLTGLIACAKVDAGHPAARDLPPAWQAPHSRFYDLAPDRLEAAGYRLISRAGADGADLFVHDGLPFLFCQGHLEYEADTLFREYRRDLAAWAGAGPPPPRPRNYFATAAERHLDSYIEEARAGSPGAFPTAACTPGLGAPWQPVAEALYRRWLSIVVSAARAPHASAA